MTLDDFWKVRMSALPVRRKDKLMSGRAGAGISGARLVRTDCERRRRRLALLRAAALCVADGEVRVHNPAARGPFPC